MLLAAGLLCGSAERRDEVSAWPGATPGSETAPSRRCGLLTPIWFQGVERKCFWSLFFCKSWATAAASHIELGLWGLLERHHRSAGASAASWRVSPQNTSTRIAYLCDHLYVFLQNQSDNKHRHHFLG